MLNVKDFKAVAADEITAEIILWNQKVTVVLCIELDEDEENEKHYIKKAQKFIEKNIKLINGKIEYLESIKDKVLDEVMNYNPVQTVQMYIENRLDNSMRNYYTLNDSTEVKLPLSESDFLEKLLICESVDLEIDATDEEEPEIIITVSFGVKDELTGGHGWDIEIG
jgi:hypothetical protein